MRLRKIAAASTLALTAAGLAGVVTGTAASAQGTGTYTCTLPALDPVEFVTVADTALPATLVYGQSAPVKGSVTITVPADLAELAYGFLNARTASGTAAATFTSGVAKASIPKTAINATGPLVMKIPVSAGTFKAAKVGANQVKLNSYTAEVDLNKADGTSAMHISPSCTPKGAAIVADTVNVVKAPTTAKVTAKGAKKKAVVTVKVSGKFGTKATGAIKVKVGKKTAKGTVKNGVAKVTVKGLKKGKNKITVTFAGDANHNASKGAGSVKVK